VPGDFSAAAPFVVAATLLPGSELTIHDVGLNPRRTGLLDVLARMGARDHVFHRHRSAASRSATSRSLGRAVATTVTADEVPLLVDELPLFALAAACARGRAGRGRRELRVKETDRIETVTTSLAPSAARHGDRRWPRVRGVLPALRVGRCALTATIDRDARRRRGLRLAGRRRARGPEAVAVSFPGFFELLDSVTQR
jgi:3-phosphoshikimate 1-carboxyvinyltransferase